MFTRIKTAYREINEKTGRRLGILEMSLATYTDRRATQAAASLAYYTIFSLFPLLLVMTAIASFFLDRSEFYQYLARIIQISLPVSDELISENLNHLIAARGTVGLVALLTLIWSASGMFTGLVNNISLAWPEKSRRNFLEVRLIGVGLVVGLSALLVISLIGVGILNVSPMLDKENGSTFTRDLWNMITGLGSWLSLLILFLVLYRWIPSTNVPWNATMLGALFTTAAWKLAIWGFTWYLHSGFGQYQVVYGTLGAIVAMLFLVYILANITLFGAHLSAAIDHWENGKNTVRN